MLSINRFDGTNHDQAPPPSSSSSSAPSSSRLAALAEKKKRKRDDADDGATPPGPAPTTSTASPRTPASGPQIHPSRLASAPLLAQSVKKANTASGVKKEKTKAKQRYLNKKKSKRKATKAAKKKETVAAGEPSNVNGAAAKPSIPKPTPLPVQPKPNAGQEEIKSAVTSSASSSSWSSSSSSSESGSDSDDESDTSDDDQDTQHHTDQPSPAQDADAPSLQPLPRTRPLHHTTQDALRSLAAQGLPRGMAQPTIVDPSLRGQVSQADGEATQHLGITLHSSIARCLADMNVTEWFAVQTAVIPHLLSIPSQPSPFNPPRDLCVSAPTGSGKTLAYAIPIISHLRTRTITRLRALVILPTRDLIIQVRETLQLLAKGTGLKIGSTAGSQSFAQEQQSLGANQVDILITTPGRLVDHLDETQGFTLEHLRFLVIDEADRLLGQSFHGWAKRLRESLSSSSSSSSASKEPTSTAHALHRLQKLNPPTSNEAACDPFKPQSLAQKLLFSATLTRDVGKLSELGLRDPVFIDVREQGAEGPSKNGEVDGVHGAFTLPATLREHMLVVSSALKPFFLIWLLQMNPIRQETKSSNGRRKVEWTKQPSPMRGVLIFTKSVDSAHRLVRLLELFFKNGVDTPRISTYTSDLTPAQRRTILTSFKQNDISILVASDLISRGIDVPSVEHVISYDTPSDVAKYVHRSGRTARGMAAGTTAQGDCWSLVEEHEARWFKREIVGGGKIRRGQGKSVERVKVSEEQVEADLGGAESKSRYEMALKATVDSYKRASV